MSEDSIEQEKAIIEYYGPNMKIIEIREKCVLFNLTAPHKGVYVASCQPLSQFSVQNVNSVGNIDTAFELCVKFVNIEKMIKYNFKWSTNNNHEIVIGLTYYIYTCYKYLCIMSEEDGITKFHKSSVTIYDILDYPALQQFRINHSKPVNRITID